MNKKPISILLQHQNFSSILFKQSISLVQSIKQTTPLSKIPIQLIRSNNQIKKKQQQIQTLLSKTIKLFGEIVGTEKNTLSTVKDYAVDVFEQLTDVIQTQCQQYNQKKRSNVKKQINTINNNKQQQQSSSINTTPTRPQQLNPSIKPSSFSLHSHKFPSTQHLKLTCPRSPTPSSSLTQPYQYICTLQSFNKMLIQLSPYKQLAIDLQHSNKSYQGFTCLMQISSRQKDYIIDVFPIWEHMHKLKSIFESQHIIKVMHGADMDTKWLQRDFDIHIVNLFDTYKASRVLGYPKFSLAYLLSHYCNTYTDKKYQLADWTIRPLLPEMLHYARLDTHYLLEIFDKLLIDLTQLSTKMNNQPQEIIMNIYKSSYQVTKVQVELFNYQKKQIYQNVKNDMKQSDFIVIQKVFWLINKIAKQQNQNFDQLVNKKTLLDIISRLKDIIINKKASIDNLRIKIDRLIGVLRSHKHSKIHLLLIPLKKLLEKQFLEKKKQQQSIIKKKLKQNNQKMLIQTLGDNMISNNNNNKVQRLDNNNNKIQQQQKQQQKFIYQPIRYNIQQLQYPLKTYENFSMQQKLTQPNNKISLLSLKIQFKPIMSFLSQKLSLTKKAQQIQEQQSQQQQQQQISQRMQLQNNDNINTKQIQQGQMQGFMQFKRIKPNVIYTIEQQQQQQKEIKSKPKKKRKQQEYQKKLKNKQGNIYDLLEDV